MNRLEFALRQLGLYRPMLTDRQLRTVASSIKRAASLAEAGKHDKLVRVQADRAIDDLCAFVALNMR